MCLEKMENTFDSLETAFEQQDSLNNSLCVSQFASEQSSTKEGRKYFESDGEIGNRKGDTFIALTNFSIRCTGYVARDANATSADGFLLDIVPKESVCSAQNDNNSEDQEKR